MTGGPRVRRRSRPGGVRWLEASEVLLDCADVVVIGGGATGVGLLWDLVLRGLDVVLVEQAGLGSGTSGAFHGLLHSGARYAGTDPRTAAECLAENRILRRVARSFVKDTGGVFVRLEEDDPEWERRWRDGCQQAGLRPRRVVAAELLTRQPSLSSRIAAAYRVPDAAVDGFGLLWSMVWAAAEAGARVYFRTRVTGLLTDEAGVRGVRVVGLGGREEDAAREAAEGRVPRVEPGEITASVVVNATGPWARDTAALGGAAQAAAVPVRRDKGTMVVFNSRLVTTVVNRLRPPGDGDIFVPHGPVTILGTTSAVDDGPGRPSPTPGEVERILDQGRALVPNLDDAAPLRAYAGVRPLLVTAAEGGGSPGSTGGGVPGARGADAAGRGAGRGFLLVDHGEGGLPGLVTIAGGKFTTFRAMAAAAGDLVTRLLGKRAACRTAEVGIPRLGRHPRSRPAGPRPGPGPSDLGGPLVCECELVNLSSLLSLFDAGLGLADARRLARVGMGACQAVFCASRLTAALWMAGWPGTRSRPRADEGAIRAEVAAFGEARGGGTRVVEWGSQARLSAVAQALDQLTLGRPAGADADRGRKVVRE